MSSVLNAILLGIIQGLTEFLPVSSSGHLEIAKVMLGDDSLPSESLAMTIVLHAATALSTIVILRKEIKTIVTGILQFKWNEEFQFAAKILLSMLPAVCIGLVFEQEIDSMFNGNLLLVGGMLLVTGLLLFLADKAKNTDKKVGFKSALYIGISQAIAILPGISRSGATISTSVLLGIDREKAARFSFLMVIPLIFGKMAKDVVGGEISIDNANFMALTIGFISAFITGMIACKWMIQLVKKSQLKYFAYYCFIIGFVVIFATSL